MKDIKLIMEPADIVGKKIEKVEIICSGYVVVVIFSDDSMIVIRHNDYNIVFGSSYIDDYELVKAGLMTPEESESRRVEKAKQAEIDRREARWQEYCKLQEEFANEERALAISLNQERAEWERLKAKYGNP